MLLLDRGDDRLAAAAWQVDVEQHHVGEELVDHLDRRAHVIRLAHHLYPVADLGADPRAEQAVIVDEHDTRQRPGLGIHRLPPPFASADAADRGIVKVTFVPSPTADCTAAEPPWRLIRPWTD